MIRDLERLCVAAMIFLCVLLLAVVSAPAATLLPNGKQQFLNANGAPLAGGFVYFYIPNTLTPKDTYQDSGQTILNSNPVVLDSAGEAIIYGSGSYRQIVTDSSNNLVWDQLTADTSAAGSTWGGTSTGSANAQSVAAPSFSLSTGNAIYFRAGFTNTGTLTLNVNSTGPLAVYVDTNAGPQALSGGEVAASNVAGVTYDGTLGGYHLIAPSKVGSSITVQRFTGGSGTYTPTANVQKIRVRMVGGGGGGGGADSSGAAGGNTTLGTWSVHGGGSGGVAAPGAHGSGGSNGADGTGQLVARIAGSLGSNGSASTAPTGGAGGGSPFGLGAPAVNIAVSGFSATGYGGGGGGGAVPVSQAGGGGGGGGEYVEFWIIGPSAMAYSIGAAGTGGTGAQTGGSGSGGLILIEEFYN